MAGSGGPWGGNGGDDRGGDDDERRGKGNGRRPGEGPQIPEIDELMRKGQEQLRLLMGGRGRGAPPGGSGGRVPGSPMFTRQGLVLGGLAEVAMWGFMSFYTV